MAVQSGLGFGRVARSPLMTMSADAGTVLCRRRRCGLDAFAARLAMRLQTLSPFTWRSRLAGSAPLVAALGAGVMERCACPRVATAVQQSASRAPAGPASSGSVRWASLQTPRASSSRWIDSLAMRSSFGFVEIDEDNISRRSERNERRLPAAGFLGRALLFLLWRAAKRVRAIRCCQL